MALTYVILFFANISVICGLNLYVAGFMPYRFQNKENYNVIKTATDSALEVVNGSPNLLPKHKLKIIWNDSKVTIL
jgi:TM2 domain-containing membrane protein YozV